MKNKLHYLFVLVFWISTIPQIQAQNKSYIDSLEKAIANPANDSMLAVNLNHLAWSFIQTDPQKGLKFSQKALNISLRDNDTVGIAKGLIVSGTLYHVMGERDSAVAQYKRTATIQEAKKNYMGLASVWNNLGAVYLYDGKLRQATDFLIKALDIYLVHGNEEEIAYSAVNLGNVFSEMGEFEQAAPYYKRHIKAARLLKDSASIAQGLTNYGAANRLLGNLEEAENSFVQALTIFRKIENKTALPGTLGNYAALLLKKNKHTEALKILKEAEEIIEESQSPIELGVVLRLSAIAHSELKNKAEAYSYLQKARDFLGDECSAMEEIELLGSEGEVYENFGEHAKSLKVFKTLMALKDSMLNARTTSEIAELETRFQTAEKEAEIQRLSQAEKIALLQAEQADIALSQRNTQMGLFALLVLLLAGGGGFFVYRGKQQQKSKLQEAIIQEREQGLIAVVNAQEEERRRIAKDLHDGIGQQLSGLKMSWSALAQTLDEAKIGHSLTNLTDVLDGSCTEVREMSHRMMPWTLQAYGLANALEDMVEKTFQSGTIAASFDSFGLEGRLDESVELSLFRVGQELVNNVIKHSEATEIFIQLNYDNGHLLLSVEDNGKGFDPIKARNQGLGLRNIEGRLQTINGKINYSKSGQQGTVATVEVDCALVAA